VAEALVGKLRDLPPIAQLAVLDAVEIFNAHRNENTVFHTADISGLTYDVDPETDTSFIQAAIDRGELVPRERGSDARSS
jgi:hypothetical protein